MPEYDATNYPKPEADNLTDAEAGRDSASDTIRVWPSSNMVPDTYAGPPPSREFETAGLGHHLVSRPPASSSTGTTNASSVMPSIAPPPGHE
jgi:hypothetical protein